MRTTQITGIELNGSDVATADAQLKVASSTEAVDVTAEGPLVNTDDQTISDTITSRAVIDLPRDSRNVYSFLYLNPNITQSGTDGSFKFLGAQSYGANFSLDGQRSNGGIFGEPTSSQPSLEAVGDINVLSNDFSAEYAGIANIRVTTKRGGAGYHGSAFYNNKNAAFAAWTLQDQIGKAEFAPTPFQSKYPNPYFNITDLGGSLGGPIPKLKKTWFFAAYERNWTVQPVNVQSITLPHPSLWGGDFSLLVDASKPNVPPGVTLTPQEIAEDTVGGAGQQFITIPSRLLNPVVQSLIGTYFPKIGLSAPINSSTGRIPGYHTILPTRSVQDLGTLRVDHDFSEKDRVSAVYNAAGQTIANTLVQTPYTGLGLTQNDRRNDTVSFSYTRVFNTTVVNEARAGFNHQKLRRHSNTTLESFLSGIGFDPSDLDAYGAVVARLVRISIIGLAMVAAAVAALVLTGMQDNAIYSKPVDQLLAQKAKFAGRPVRAEGNLIHGSLMKREQPCEYRFSIAKNGVELPVRFAQCVVPDTFRDVPDLDVGVTVEGELQSDDSFEATSVLAKCPSKYEMKQRKDHGEQMPHGSLASAGSSPGPQAQ